MSVMAPPSSEVSSSMHRASAALLHIGDRRGRTILDVRRSIELQPLTAESAELEETIDVGFGAEDIPKARLQKFRQQAYQAAGQIPAIVLVCLLNLMLAIPFGVSYFPIGWSADGTPSEDLEELDGINGGMFPQSRNSVQNVSSHALLNFFASTVFPLPGKEALGIR